MTTTESVILAIVEGLTEFLPVSSTGHLILTESLFKMNQNSSSDYLKLITVCIQPGAILSVFVLYFRRFFQTLDFYFKIVVAFIPAAVFGLLLNKKIDALLDSPQTVAISFIIGGVILIIVDRTFHKQIETVESDTEIIKETNEFGVDEKKEVLTKFSITWLQAFVIGCFQCLAMIPGVSRSAATIVGGLTQKLTIKRAAEFSFFLALPTIFGASVVTLYHKYSIVKGSDLSNILLGNVIAFVVGLIAIKFFIGLITRYGLKFFGYYRIIIGIVILVLLATHKIQRPA